MNVLKKIVIPRLNVTNTYILMELEEIAREEFSRLKKVKEKKKRDKAEFENKDELSNIKDIDVERKTTTIGHYEKNNLDAENASSSKVSSASASLEEKLFEVKNYFDEITLQAKDLIKNGDNNIDTSTFLEKYEKAKQIMIQLLDRSNYKKLDKIIGDKLEYLKSYLGNTASIKENYGKTNLPKSENTLQEANDTVTNEVGFSKNGSESVSKENNAELQEFKDIVMGVEKITSAYIKQGLLSQSMEKFVQSCNEVKLKLDNSKNAKNIYNQPNGSLNKLRENTSINTTNNDIKKISDIENKNNSRIKLNVEDIMNLIDNLNLEGNIDGLTKTTNLESTKETTEEACDCTDNSEIQSLQDSNNNKQSKNTSTETLKNYNNISCRKVCKKVCFMCSRSLDKNDLNKNRCEICKSVIRSKTTLKNDDVKITASEETQTKWNVLSKLIIPRVNLSCHYIISELEEIEREDNFRLKRFKELKIKKAKGKEDPAKAGGKPCECSPNLKAKESVREAPKPVSISESNTCNVICGEHTEKKEIDSLEKSDMKLKEVCSVCETDKDKLKPNLENELDKNICVICKDMKDSKKSELDSKIPESICSNCMMQQNNKTVELKRAINSESICPACTDKMINKENKIDLTTKDCKYSKNIYDQAECLYCKNKDQTEKSKIEICKECQVANSKSQVTNIIDEKRTIYNDNFCPACTDRTINEGKDIMSQNTLEKKACIYCKREGETIDKSKMNVCQGFQINNAKKEESCPFCSKTAESTLPNKSEGQNNICVNCKKAKTDKNQLNVNKEKCLYCKKDGPNNNKPKVEVCQKCMHTKSDINNKDECLFCRKKAETNVQSKTEVCKECQAMNAKSETIKDSNIRCPACKDVAMNKLSKITINKEECSYCKKRKQTIDKPQVEECKDCQVKNAKSEVKNTTDDKEGCPYCNKTKGIEFIDQRNIISPTDSILSVLNKSSEQNKMCATCKKAEINKIQTVTRSELCQLCEENRAESNLKKEELCSECKSKNNKIHNNNKDIKKQKRQSCSTCQSPESDDDHKCHCSDSAQRKTFAKNISNTCSSCGKKSSNKSFTTDTFSCSCKNDTKNKQDTLNNMSDARGTFKEIVKIKRFSGADGITHEHITVTSKKTQKRILPEPSCGKNNNNCIKDTKSHSIDLKKRNSNLKASSNIYSESSGVCLSSCSSNKNYSEISSKNNSSEIASITSRSFSCNPEGANALKKCEATCVLEPDKEYRKKETDGCVACMKSSSRMSCGKDKSHDIREVKSCPNNNNYNKIKIIIKDDKCKDNSDDEEVELTPSTIVILKKILSRTSKSADSCKSNEKENKNANSKCSCGTQQSNSKVNTSLKIKKVKSAPCMKNTDCIDKKSSKNKKLCRTCDEQGTNSKQNKNTCNKCQKDSPEMSKQRTTAGSCQECGKKKNNNPSGGKNNCNCNKRTNCKCKKIDTKVERTCSCSKKQKVTIEKTCSCNKTNSKQISKCSSVESKHSQCCSESNETSSMANQTCLMDRLPVSKADSGTCVCNEKKPAKSKLKDNCPCSDQNQTQTMTRTCSGQSMNKNTPCSPSTNKSPECSCKSTKKIADDDDCQCAKQIQPPPESGSCSCQSVNKNASLANKPGDCSCRSSTKDKNNDPKNNDICPCSKKSQSEPKAGTCSCQSVNKNSSLANKSGDCICKSSKKDKNSDTCSCSKQNQPQPKTSTCSCQSVNKNALCCLPSNKSRECSCKSTTKKVNDECPCSKLNAKPLTSICSCQSVNKSSQGRDCSNSVQDKSPCSCREINSKEQNTCGKLETDTGTQQCSCSQPVKSLKSNLKFNSDPPQSLCPCQTSETGQKINKSKSCSCKSEKEIIKSYGIQGLASTSPCQASKLPYISPTHSNQSTTVASQTCCLPVDKPEKSIKFCDKASFTPNFAKSPSSVSPKSSYISLRSRSSQIKSSQCSCGRKEASTMTRRTDRYDVRTLRQLTYHPEPKNVSCLCKSDSALLQIGKPKNIKPLKKCQSLNNECCLRK